MNGHTLKDNTVSENITKWFRVKKDGVYDSDLKGRLDRLRGIIEDEAYYKSIIAARMPVDNQSGTSGDQNTAAGSQNVIDNM